MVVPAAKPCLDGGVYGLGTRWVPAAFAEGETVAVLGHEPLLGSAGKIRRRAQREMIQAARQEKKPTSILSGGAVQKITTEPALYSASATVAKLLAIKTASRNWRRNRSKSISPTYSIPLSSATEMLLREGRFSGSKGSGCGRVSKGVLTSLIAGETAKDELA